MTLTKDMFSSFSFDPRVINILFKDWLVYCSILAFDMRFVRGEWLRYNLERHGYLQFIAMGRLCWHLTYVRLSL